MDSSKKKRAYSCLIFTLVSCAVTRPALAETEEQRLTRIAQMLKPISDNAWNEIAGGKSGETYDVQKGDTLWDVSKRLFGNAYYWPKVWSLNAGIRNPHIVAPGQKLMFVPGSSESTPRLAPATGTSTTTATSAENSSPIMTVSDDGKPDYLNIDPNKWKPVDPRKETSTIYDDMGFEIDRSIIFRNGFSFRVPAIANETTIPFLGEIVGSRRNGVGLSQHETIFLRSTTQDLQVGTTYSVLSEPKYIREKKSDRTAYVYRSTGEVKIVGVKDELYIGAVTKSTDVLKRGDHLYPLLPLITDIKPVAASSALEALVVGSQGTQNISQYHVMHLDRGIEDGVQIGNIFRIYEYYDPTTKAKITDSDFLIHADAIVVHATAQFSTALVITARDTFSRGDFGVLLTDVSEFEKKKDLNIRDFDEKQKTSPEDQELDELDALDRESGDGLGKQEETEIKELDHWDSTKDMQNDLNAEPTEPASPGQPTDDVEQNPTTPPSGEQPTLDESLDSPRAEPSLPESAPPLETPAEPGTDYIPEDQSMEAPNTAPPTEPSIPSEATTPSDTPLPSDSEVPDPSFNGDGGDPSLRGEPLLPQYNPELKPEMKPQQ